MGQEKITQELTGVGREILEDSRGELYMDQHYLALALGSLSFAFTTEIDGIGTDGEVLAAHPKALADLYVKDRRLVNRIFLHQVYHCLFRHIFRRIPARADLWMLACDMACEFLIDRQDNRSTRVARSRLRENTRAEISRRVKVLNAEGIYHALLQIGPDEEMVQRLMREFCVDDHSLWPALRTNPERPSLPPQSVILKNRWEDLSKKTQTQMEAFSTEASSGSKELLEETRVENRERMEYRTFLRKFSALREEMHMDPDSYDPILYSMGLQMYGNMPLIEPVETREVKKIEDFVVVIDTSMSVSGPLVHSFLEQTYSVLSESESFLHKVNIRILQCDEKVLSDKRIESQKDLSEYMEHMELLGGGGTDFRPAFSYTQELIRNKEFRDLRGLLYFTDGKGIYPEKKPPFETAFIFCSEEYEDRQVPPWAIRLILPAAELEAERKDLSKTTFIWDKDQV